MRSFGVASLVLALACAGCEAVSSYAADPTAARHTHGDDDAGLDLAEPPDLVSTEGRVDGPTLLAATFGPTADVFVLSGRPDLNFGDSTELRLGFCSVTKNAEMRSWLAFDVSNLPTAARIDAAEIAIYFDQHWGTQPYDLHRAAAGWDELTVTWNNQPAFDAESSATNPGFTVDGWQRWEVRALVVDAVAGDGVLAVVIKGNLSGGSDHENWGRSRAYPDPATRPRLQVGYHLP